MTTQTLTLADFLLARIAEDEALATAALTRDHWRYEGYGDFGPYVSGAEVETPDTDQGPQIARHIEHMNPWRLLAECEAKRRIIEWHKNWPVLVETPPQLEPGADPHAMTMRMTQQIMWTTEQEYRGRFGSEPPTGPILRFLALPYADHPGFREEWRA